MLNLIIYKLCLQPGDSCEETSFILVGKQSFQRTAHNTLNICTDLDDCIEKKTKISIELLKYISITENGIVSQQEGREFGILGPLGLELLCMYYSCPCGFFPFKNMQPELKTELYYPTDFKTLPPTNGRD